MNRKKLFLFIIVILAIFSYPSMKSNAAETVESNLYVAYPINDMTYALDVSLTAPGRPLITYKSHGRGNQLLDFEYRSNEDAYIIRMSNQPQYILKEVNNTAVRAIQYKDPINNLTKFEKEYLWEITETDDNHVFIKSKSNNMVMTIPNIRNQAEIQLTTLNSGDKSQLFKLQTMNGIYKIRSVETNNLGWDIRGGVSAGADIISYPLGTLQSNQLWMILFKPNDNFYVITNYQKRNLIVNQNTNTLIPNVIKNDKNFETSYSRSNLFFFRNQEINPNNQSIVHIINGMNSNLVYKKLDEKVAGPGRVVQLEAPSSGRVSNQEWLLEKIQSLPKPTISNLSITGDVSTNPVSKFYVGEKLTVKGQINASGFSTYDLYAKYNTATPTLLSQNNALNNAGTANFEAMIDTADYKEGNNFIEFFGRADSMFMTNSAANEYTMVYPTPTGTPVPKTILQRTPMNRLNPSDFIKDLTDEIGSQDITVESISNIDTNKLGNQTANVLIKNKYKTNTIEVPIQIVPNKWGEVPWEFDETTGTLYLMESGTLGIRNQSPWNMTGPQRVASTQIKKIELKKDIKAPVNSNYLFSGLSNLEKIDYLNKLDTTSTTEMHQMFSELPKIKQLDLSNFKTNKVTNFASMFRNNKEISSLDVSSFDTSNAFNLGNMFNGMSKLTELDLKNFKTQNIEFMDNMFNGDTSLKNLDISSFDTSKVVNMSNMFINTPLMELNLAHFKTDNVTNMSGMFSNMTNLTDLNIAGFSTEKVTNQANMFAEDTQLSKLSLGENFRFTSDSNLPNIIKNDEFTGNWKSLGTRPYIIGTSQEFISNYDGSRPGTYIWQKYNTDVNMTINYYQWLEGKASTKKVISDLTKSTRKEASIEIVSVKDISVSELLNEEVDFAAPEVRGYLFDNQDFKRTVVSLTNAPETEIKLTDKMPTQDFTINYYYEPTTQLGAPTEINFGKQRKKEKVSMYQMIPSEEKMNNEIFVIDTYETESDKPNWTLYASTDGFYNEQTGVRLLANIILKNPEFSDPKEITSESTPLFIDNNGFEKKISLVDKKEEDGLFVKVGKVSDLGKYNGILKYKLQAAP